MSDRQDIFANDSKLLEAEIVGRPYVDDTEKVISFSNTKKYSMFGFIVVLLCFVGGGAWSTTALLDSAFQAPGTVIIEGNRKSVQHLEGGIISDILVAEGDVVEQGQPIMLLDTTTSEANLNRIELRLFANAAKRERLEVERDQLDALAFSAALQAQAAEDDRLSAILQAEYNNFVDRRASMDKQSSLIDQRIKSTQSEIQALSDQIGLREQRIELIEPVLENLQALLERQIVTKSEVLEQEQTLTILRGEVRQFSSQQNARNEQLKALEIEKSQLATQFNEEVTFELSSLETEIEDLKQQYSVAKDTHERRVIAAPISGSIQSLTNTTIGGIVGPGEKLMEVIPLQQSLIVEASVTPDHRDNLEIGQDAQVLFTAFDLQHTPAIFGKVNSISGDVVIDSASNAQFFRTLIEVSQDELAKLDGKTLSAGMPAQVMISTGEQTLWTYISKPVRDAMRGALSEQ